MWPTVLVVLVVLVLGSYALTVKVELVLYSSLIIKLDAGIA